MRRLLKPEINPIVFLGGTTNGSKWRELLIPLLKEHDIDYFNPVVDNWDDAAYQRELKARGTSDFVLYCITPKMQGVYSIAEAVDDSNKQPEKVIFMTLAGDGIVFTAPQIKSLNAVKEMITENGGFVAETFEQAVDFMLNGK